MSRSVTNVATTTRHLMLDDEVCEVSCVVWSGRVSCREGLSGEPEAAVHVRGLCRSGVRSRSVVAMRTGFTVASARLCIRESEMVFHATF